jgi:N6-L-threonylcarbamoyladenine synthase/ribosomal-protein-alanine N-acetyltransferase
MALSQRTFRGPADWADMLAVVEARPAEHLHVVDLPYRLCSWAFDQPANCSLWEDAGGRVVAWAVFQSPFWSIDYAIHPLAPPDTLDLILAWADRHARAIQSTPFARPCWFINGFTGQADGQALEAAGFHSQADVGEDSWTKVLFQRSITPLPDAQPLPDGLRIRPLKGPAESDAYVALHRAVFGSENMTSAWRQRTLSHPAYLPQLDLVAIDADDRLAGFCIGWFTARGPQQQPAGQIEPIGVREDMRGRGLGRALLAECLARMAALGATSALVETDNYRDVAYNFYLAAGFQIQRHVTVYRKDYP